MNGLPATVAARAFVAGLVASGVTDACITPGSRSTPLTLAFAEHPGIKSWLHLDERSSSFFALGLSRATGRAVAVVCTSGTAASNFAPAVAEANRSRIPLIFCTTDRPPRLRDRGADQTINQVGMFGDDVRKAFDLPLATEAGPGADGFFASEANRAVRAALGPLAGPVQVNFPFEEPLVESPGERPPLAVSSAPVRGVEPIVLQPSAADLAAALDAIEAASRPLIVAGPETGGLPVTLLDLGARISAPVLADSLSGLRAGHADSPVVLDSFDAILRDPAAIPGNPDVILKFGGPPTSKALNGFLAKNRGVPHLLFDVPGAPRDPDTVATQYVAGDPVQAIAALLPAVSVRAESPWLDDWRTRDRAAREAMQAAAASFDEVFEGRVYTELQRALPEGATILSGNSMPVRDLDSFLTADAPALRLVSNRGVNGIDGVTSSALGHAAAGDGPVVLVIGDLSFYHDLNGLWAAKRHGLDMTVVLVNNDGGGIFHYLPQAKHDDFFEEWFGTQLGVDLSLAVRMYGGDFVSIDSWDTFRAELAKPHRGLRVLEVKTDRYRNTMMHQQGWTKAAEAARAAAVMIPA